MPRGAFVVNRFRLPPHATAARLTEEDVKAAIRSRGLALDDDAPGRLVRAYADQVKLAALDATHVLQLSLRAGTDVAVVRVPELPSDVHDLKLLAQIADHLMATSPTP